MSIPAESITYCDTKQFFNRANLYFTITYTYINWTDSSRLRSFLLRIGHLVMLNHVSNNQFAIIAQSAVSRISKTCDHPPDLELFERWFRQNSITSSEQWTYENLDVKLRHIISTSADLLKAIYMHMFTRSLLPLMTSRLIFVMMLSVNKVQIKQISTMFLQSIVK